MCKQCGHEDHTGKVCHCLCRHPWPQLFDRKMLEDEHVSSEDCMHPDDSRRVVSEVVVLIGIYNDADGAHDYETVRQIFACHNCGSFLEQRDIERPPT